MVETCEHGDLINSLIKLHYMALSRLSYVIQNSILSASREIERRDRLLPFVKKANSLDVKCL